METDYVEIFSYDPNTDRLQFVSTEGDWLRAALRAAREPYVEIVAYLNDPHDGTVVYSDNPDLHSGGWWSQAIRQERRRLGVR